ncbi:MAG: RNase adapter RapZ [Panacagrimonas sp.]
MKLIVVSGLSGAGKTVALKQYEDLGYTCIDNIPLALIGPMITRMLRKADGSRYERLAIGIDARETRREIARFPQHLAALRKRGVDVRVIFLSATDEVLLHRYGDTRRPHPLGDEKTSLLEAIALERRLLAPIANLADEPLDTTSMNLHQLREAIHQRLPEAETGKLAVLFLSFGFKNGAPNGCDYLFDVRCLPNPHWDPSLKHLTGRDGPVREWLSAREDVQRMLQDIGNFLEPWLPAFRRQDRAYVTIGVGCTGGQHRSVYLVERLAERFRDRFDPVIVKHKELR